MKKMGR